MNDENQRGDGLLQRRRFIKHVLFGTAASTMLSRRWLTTVVADCTPTTANGGILRVKVSDFPALQSEGSSVRLLLNPINNSSHMPSGSFYPVLISRGAGTQFFAFSGRCTHQGCVLPPFGDACPCHGSSFNIDGTVSNGPATSPLAKYTIFFDGNDLLCVEVPNLRYVVTATAVSSAAGPRIQLRVPTRSGVKYQVLRRSSVTDGGSAVQFSTTQDGAATASTLTGNNQTLSMFVDRAADAGLYSVVVVVSEG